MWGGGGVRKVFYTYFSKSILYNFCRHLSDRYKHIGVACFNLLKQQVQTYRKLTDEHEVILINFDEETGYLCGLANFALLLMIVRY